MFPKIAAKIHVKNPRKILSSSRKNEFYIHKKYIHKKNPRVVKGAGVCSRGMFEFSWSDGCRKPGGDVLIVIDVLMIGGWEMKMFFVCLLVKLGVLLD